MSLGTIDLKSLLILLEPMDLYSYGVLVIIYYGENENVVNFIKLHAIPLEFETVQ